METLENVAWTERFRHSVPLTGPRHIHPCRSGAVQVDPVEEYLTRRYS